MFGKQLYSNASSAISELVANGLDAKAKNIYLTVDVRDKENSYVEIYDDGIGMSSKDISEHYIKIGYNKRKNEVGLDDGKTLGRKGIGKLAALFLSDSFSIITKKENTSVTCWKLDVSMLDNDATPQLEAVSIENYKDIKSCQELLEVGHGTIISLKNVKLKGMGGKAFEGLEQKLSNLFLYDKLSQHIWIKLIENNQTKYEFKLVSKHIAFKNLAYVYTTNNNYVKECENNRFCIPYKTKTELEKKMYADTEIIPLNESGIMISGEKSFGGVKKKYALDGWIGIHATIDGDDARHNDSRYVKNQFYNPNQLRVYVRNKLAMGNMIEYLGITRAFVNYIEGEVSFDILDDDDLEDIATAGRQDFNTQDERFILLKDILIKIGNSLVSKRQELADKVKAKKRDDDIDISSKSKANFKKEFHKMLDKVSCLEQKDKDSIEAFTLSQIEGELPPEFKSEFTVFISHSGKDHIFSDFIFKLLTSLGFNGDPKDPKREIFYSSSGLDTDDLTPLSILIKQYIIRKNNDILFLVTQNFGTSEYCLFEGGAAWATKSVGDYKILALTYESIPKFLTNGKSEIVLGVKKIEDLTLDGKKYNYLVQIINRCINQLNKNRVVSGLDVVPLFKEVNFPDKVELKALNKTERDYMDEKILNYWDSYVIEDADEYFKKQ